MPQATETSLSDPSRPSSTVLAAVLASALLGALPASAQDADTQATGAGSVVKQTYGAWQVSCRTPPGAKEEKCALVQSVTAARCYNCATMLQPDTDFRGNCPKCGAALHCCKQCAHFEPSKLFQCLKPIPARIALKDQANECTWFGPSVTVARDATRGGSIAASGPTQSPRGPSEARAAFDSLFKK